MKCWRGLAVGRRIVDLHRHLKTRARNLEEVGGPSF